MVQCRGKPLQGEIMDYQVEKLEKNKAKIVVTLNQQEWQKEIDAAYNKHKGRYNITGFRPGKAPKKVIEQHFGAGVFYEDAMSDCFYQYYFEILEKEKELQPIDYPKLNILDISPEKLVVEAVVELQPEVVVKKYTGFQIPNTKKEVTDKEVEAKLNEFVEQNARFVDTQKPVKNGDLVNLNFSGSIQGKKFKGGTAEGYDLTIGSHSFIDTFEDQLIGLQVGDEKEVAVTFPTPYQAKELEGKPAVFKVKINSIKEKQVPQLNDELVANATEFKTVEEYKADILKQLQVQAAEQADAEQQNAILNKVLENTQMDIPSVLVEHELEHMMEDFNMRLMYQGLSLDAYLKYMNTTLDAFKKERRVDAEKNVKLSYALQHILSKEGLDLTDAELQQHLAENAKLAQKTVEEYTKTIDEHRMGHIKNDILMKKLVDFLVKNN